jgi:hypothetical protein
MLPDVDVRNFKMDIIERVCDGVVSVRIELSLLWTDCTIAGSNKHGNYVVFHVIQMFH